MRRIRRLLLLTTAVLAVLALSLFTDLFHGLFGERSGTGPEAGPPPTGRVRTASGAPPPAGVRVVALGDSGPLGETGTAADGSFRFDPVPEGTTGFAAVCGPLRGRVSGTEFAEIVLPKTFDAAGRVVRRLPVDAAEAMAAVAGAEVILCGRSAFTDERGRFHLEEVEAPDGAVTAFRVRPPDAEAIELGTDRIAAWDDVYLILPR